jgi:hypothetical protein
MLPEAHDLEEQLALAVAAEDADEVLARCLVLLALLLEQVPDLEGHFVLRGRHTHTHSRAAEYDASHQAFKDMSAKTKRMEVSCVQIHGWWSRSAYHVPGVLGPVLDGRLTELHVPLCHCPPSVEVQPVEQCGDEAWDSVSVSGLPKRQPQEQNPTPPLHLSFLRLHMA